MIDEKPTGHLFGGTLQISVKASMPRSVNITAKMLLAVSDGLNIRMWKHWLRTKIVLGSSRLNYVYKFPMRIFYIAYGFKGEICYVPILELTHTSGNKRWYRYREYKIFFDTLGYKVKKLALQEKVEPFINVSMYEKLGQKPIWYFSSEGEGVSVWLYEWAQTAIKSLQNSPDF